MEALSTRIRRKSRTENSFHWTSSDHLSWSAISNEGIRFNKIPCLLFALRLINCHVTRFFFNNVSWLKIKLQKSYYKVYFSFLDREIKERQELEIVELFRPVRSFFSLASLSLSLSFIYFSFKRFLLHETFLTDRNSLNHTVLQFFWKTFLCSLAVLNSSVCI